MRDGLSEAMQRFAETLSKIDRSDLPSYKEAFFGEIERIHGWIETHPESERNRETFFRFCGNLDKSLMHGRTRQKPLGYPGDFLLIDWIYTQKTAESGIGKRFDELFHSYEAAQAVRNRKDFFVKLCNWLAKEKKADLDVLDIGCGSCRDVVEAIESRTNGILYHFHCVDQEPLAIEYARSFIRGSRAESYVQLECKNVFRIQTPKTFDLIWSAGLFDYLDKRTAALLIKKCWRNLKPGGWFVFGNFSPQNPTRKGMELVGNWFLIHRTTDQLVEIVQEAGVGHSLLEVESESLGINLFCKIRK
jgi:SAM-dependent methyltransferase